MSQVTNKEKSEINDLNQENSVENKNNLKKTNPKQSSTWKKEWWVILLTELLGTFALTLWIVLPNTMAFTTPEAHKHFLGFWEVWADIWQLMFMKGLWVVIFIIPIVYLLRPISVNLNPAVTIAEIGKKNTTLQLGSLMIVCQLIGGLMAGYAAFGISYQMGTWDPTSNIAGYHSELDSVYPRWMSYDFSGSSYSDPYNVIYLSDMAIPGIFLIFSIFFEFLFTYVLIMSIFIFPKAINHSWRPVFIGVVIGIDVTIGLRTGNFSINPARLIGPAIAHDTMVNATGISTTMRFEPWILFYLIPQIMAGLFVGAFDMNKRGLFKK